MIFIFIVAMVVDILVIAAVQNHFYKQTRTHTHTQTKSVNETKRFDINRKVDRHYCRTPPCCLYFYEQFSGNALHRSYRMTQCNAEWLNGSHSITNFTNFAFVFRLFSLSSCEWQQHQFATYEIYLNFFFVWFFRLMNGIACRLRVCCLFCGLIYII